ncbi:MAG: hypothetical protein FWC24_06580 [Treponema sp.]|nr:hypothetical protein [Treponema sp.]
MTKLSEKSRKALRVIYRGVGSVTAASFLFACNGIFRTNYPDMYGMPYPEYGVKPPDCCAEEITLQGQVICAGKPISGIGIWIKGITATPYISLTDSNGEFYFYLPKQETYTIVFSDVDGDENGQFKPFTKEFTIDDINALAGSPLIIELDMINEE